MPGDENLRVFLLQIVINIPYPLHLLVYPLGLFYDCIHLKNGGSDGDFPIHRDDILQLRHEKQFGICKIILI